VFATRVERIEVSVAHASSHIKDGPDEVDADKLDIDYTPTNYTPSASTPVSDSEFHLAGHLAGIDAVLGDVADDASDAVSAASAAQSAAEEHATRHIKDGDDELDGDLVDIDFGPTYYTPTMTSPATDLDHLAAHLSGIDIALRDLEIPDFANYHSPLGAWLLGSSRTTDLSGNGITLTEVGTQRLSGSYAQGLECSYFNTSSYLTATSSSLNVTGAWSGEMVVRISTMTNSGALANWAGTTEVEANNITWTIGRCSSVGVVGGLYWERASAVDVSINEHGVIPQHEWVHLVHTRSSSGDFKTYVNGVLTGSTTGLNMPVGGSTGRMSIGGVDTTMHNGFLAQYMAIYGADLTASQVLELARKRMAGRKVS
jgi:hypothetical protein